jgi:hypothetical protein
MFLIGRKLDLPIEIEKINKENKKEKRYENTIKSPG